MSGDNEFEYIVGEKNIDYEGLNDSRIKQSLEGLFFIVLFFLIVLTFSNIEERRVEIIPEITEEKILPYNNSYLLSDIRDIRTYKEVVVTRGDSIYKIFRDNSISYTENNIEIVEELNYDKPSIQRLIVGEKLKIPVNYEK